MPAGVLSFRAMSDLGPPAATPQFGTAEYNGLSATDHCKFCNQPVATQYYRVNDAMACASCADQWARSTPKDKHSAYARAFAFGIGAALLGMILYAAFGIMTGLVIGYLSLAVGYLVGKAMMKGSNGIGGRRYQITAVLLTYAAVSIAAIPMAIAQFSKEKKSHPTTQVSQAQPGEAQPAAEAPAKKVSFGAALAYLLFLGLASPFMDLMADPLHGLIGLVILFVGMRIAWKLTAGRPAIEVSGPFQNAAPSSN